MNSKKETLSAGLQEIFDRIECDTGLIFVDTPEETRLIREIYKKYQDHSVQFWSIGQGLHEIDRTKQQVNKFYPHKYKKQNARMGKSGDLDTRVDPTYTFQVIEEDCRDKIENEEDDTKHIYILRDLDKFLTDPMILRGLKDLIYLCSTSSSIVIVTGFGITVPNEIEKDTVFTQLGYPSKEEVISAILPNLRAQIAEHNKRSKEEDRIEDNFNDEDIAQACVGLTEDQILNSLQYTTTVDSSVCIDRILDEKKAIINKSDILEYWICNDTLEDIGGFGEIKKWFEVKKAVIKNVENALEFNAEPPKGMMLLGVQGSGKTAIAKALAQSWNVGLIKLDIGKVFAGLVGESVAPWTEFTFFGPNGTVMRVPAKEAYKKKDMLLGSGIMVQSYTRNGIAKLLPVSDIIEHIRTKNLVKVKTKSGRSVDVTEDHSLFTISDEGNLKEMTPSEMKKGTIIGVPSNYDNAYPDTLRQDKICLLNLIRNNKDEDKWLLVQPEKHIGEKLYTLTNPKSHKQYREGRPLNLSLLPQPWNLSPTGEVKAKMTDKHHPVEIYLTTHLMELFGWYSAEGSITADRLRLHIHKDELEIVNELVQKCGYESYSYQDRDSDGVTVFFGDTGLKRIFDYLCLTKKDRIPSWVLSTGTIQRQAYLRGLFSGDGGVSGSHIELSQASETFMCDVLDLLASVGIFASKYPRIDGGYRVIIHSSTFKHKYMDEIGFTQKVKNELSENLFSKDEWGHKIPFYKELKDATSAHFVNMDSQWISYKNALKINPNLKNSDVYWDVVESIEVVEEQPEYVYDISVPGNENFVAGNIICHNSEKRMRQALAQIDAAGGVVVIDELDKGLSGAGSSDKTDGGTTSRVIGTLLTWLQEDHPGVFLVATANDITNLRRNHPELLRKGRFDEIWFSDVPNEEERKEIYKIHLKKRGRDPEIFDLDKLAEFEYNDKDNTKYPPTGAEIESAVRDAIQERFAMGGGKKLKIGGKNDVTTDDILDKLAIIKPITKIAKETISSMRRWSADNARNVSTVVDSKKKKGSSNKKKLNVRSISSEDINL